MSPLTPVHGLLTHPQLLNGEIKKEDIITRQQS